MRAIKTGTTPHRKRHANAVLWQLPWGRIKLESVFHFGKVNESDIIQFHARNSQVQIQGAVMH